MFRYGLNFPYKGWLPARGGISLPCATEPSNTHYECSASDDSSNAWKAFSQDVNDKWLTTAPRPDNRGHWVQFRYTDLYVDNYGYFRTKQVMLQPPAVMSDEWYKLNNPRKVSIDAEKSDGSMITLATAVFDNWEDSSSRFIDIGSIISVRSIRVYIEENNSGSDTASLTCVHTFVEVDDNPFGIVHNGVSVKHKGETVVHDAVII